MTDTPASKPVPTADEWWSDYLKRQADYQARAKPLLERNKAAVLDALAAAGIPHVTVSFDGYGDSGQIESIHAHRGKEIVALPNVTIIMASTCWDDPAVVSTERTVAQAIEDMAYELLSQTHAGWEINDGAYGDFTFDVTARSIALDYNERFTDTENYLHEF